MANVQRANRDVNERARFGLGTDTQDDVDVPATETDVCGHDELITDLQDAIDDLTTRVEALEAP